MKLSSVIEEGVKGGISSRFSRSKFTFCDIWRGVTHCCCTAGFKIGEELPKGVRDDRWAKWLHLSGSYSDRRLGREVSYQVTRTPLGLAMMYVAGVLSGLLGIGSGTLGCAVTNKALVQTPAFGRGPCSLDR